MDDEKRFDEWNTLKINTHAAGRIPTFTEGEIWWCAVGENIGVEIGGKSQRFSRPVLVFRKLSRLGFLGIPLTSQAHTGAWYVPFIFQGKNSWAVLSQIRVFSASRLYSRIGTLPESDFDLVVAGFNSLYGLH